MLKFNPHNRVREARTRKGLSLNQLARLVGCTPQGISYLELNGKRRPRPEAMNVEKLATALDTTVDALFPEAAA